MRTRCLIFLSSVLCFFALAITVSARAGNTPTEQRCGVDKERPAQRMFADADGKRGWREYQSLKDVPELELGLGAFAAVWAGRDGNDLISLEQPGEDFAAFTDYCFDKSGRLLQLRFELRTAWGWGYRQEGPIVKGALAPQMSEFFATENEKPVEKPQYADDIADALKPHLYLQESQLPFSKLLPR